VISHARALLASDPGVIAVPGDMRDAAAVLANPDLTALIDLDRPASPRPGLRRGCRSNTLSIYAGLWRD
jgi:S-adenosyl methyltransferase